MLSFSTINPLHILLLILFLRYTMASILSLLLTLFPFLKNLRWALKPRKGLKRWRNYMSKWGLKLRRWMSNTRWRSTRTALTLSSNRKILYSYTWGMKDFPQKGRPSLLLEEMALTRLCEGYEIMLIKENFQVTWTFLPHSMLETSLPTLRMKMREMKIWGKFLYKGGGWCRASQIIQSTQSHQNLGAHRAYDHILARASMVWFF